MAGKKRKKVVANPTRGFATTSTPSKVKISTPDDSNAQEHISDDFTVNTTPPFAQGKMNQGHNGSRCDEISQMTPEQLEAYFEQAEIENFYELHSEKVKNNVARQVTRLKTERRQMRQAADQSVSLKWLDEALTDQILKGEPVGRANMLRPRKDDASTPDDFDNTLLCIWTLGKVLRDLSLPDVDKCLNFLLISFSFEDIRPNPDEIAGLKHALAWYALSYEQENLPDYDNPESAALQVARELQASYEKDLAALQTQRREVSQPEQAVEESASLESVAQLMSELGVNDIAGDSEIGTSDPDVLQNQWLDLQHAKFELQHGAKEPKIAVATTLKVITKQLEVIEKDMLFDYDRAVAIWQPLSRDLQIEHARNAKLQKLKETGKPHSERDEAITDDDQSDDAILGAIFDGDPDQNPLDRTEDSAGIISKSSIRDFGKWSGLSPRKVLEDAIRPLTKDNMQFKILSSSSCHIRLEFFITWSEPIVINPDAIASIPESTTVEATLATLKICMVGIAVPSRDQSEAFLATLTLSLLYNSRVINEKQASRLPTVWKNVYQEVEDKFSATIRAHEILTLKNLKSLIINSSTLKTTSANDQSGPITAVSETAQNLTNAPDKSEDFVRSRGAVIALWESLKKSQAFTNMHGQRSILPVHTFRQQILDAVNTNPVLIVCADTGAGKSTQIPSYILEQALNQGLDHKIMVTQPRRISAISIARRVSEELGETKEDIGTNRSLVGYAIRLESKTSVNTRLTFATTGVLLRMLQESPDLDTIDYLILDEVHERTMDLDLLFIALKQLQKRRSSLKIILMSATVDATKFSKYFGEAPILNLPGRTFPVQVLYLEDAIDRTISSRECEPTLDDVLEDDHNSAIVDSEGEAPTFGDLSKYKPQTRAVISHYNNRQIDYKLICQLATLIVTDPGYKIYSQAILIFMPGLAEIRRLNNMLATQKVFSQNCVIHMLHSTFSTQDLEKAFQPASHGSKKIVIATNIAETGITIPDITAVIDTCKEKVMRFDERRQLSRLVEMLISRASARQRRGRAARVQEGMCFHLVPRHTFETKMSEQATPEILRLSLQDPVLRVKIWRLGNIEEVLSSAMDPPTGKNIRRAISKLQDAAALDTREELTDLGYVLTKLPLDVVNAKLAIFGTLFRCLDPVLSIVALLGSKTIFVDRGDISSAEKFYRSDSDLLTLYNAYSGWRKARTANSAQQFCQKFQLNNVALGQVEEQKIQLLIYLADAKIISLDETEQNNLSRARSVKYRGPLFEIPARYNDLATDGLVSAVCAAAYYPRILRRQTQGYQNVYTNQIMHLATNSTLRSARFPYWVTYMEAIQARTGKLNVLQALKISDTAILLLLGEADFKLFCGVVAIDNNRIRFSLKRWKQMLALHILRERVHQAINRALRNTRLIVESQDRVWLETAAAAFDASMPPSKS